MPTATLERTFKAAIGSSISRVHIAVPEGLETFAGFEFQPEWKRVEFLCGRVVKVSDYQDVDGFDSSRQCARCIQSA